MSLAEQAASVGAQYIRTPNFEGVILPEGFGSGFDRQLFAYWTPSIELVLVVESLLPAFLRSFPPNQGEPKEDWHQRYAAPLILAQLPQYRRQYTGIVFEHRAALHINFVLGDDPWAGDWVTSRIQVEDGGHAYFQVVYRPDECDFVSFQVNGEA